MTSGVKYISYANSSGYGLAAVGYLRALHNAGVPVWWQPSFLGGAGDVTWRPDHGLAALPLARAAVGDASLADLPAMAEGLCRPIEYDTVMVQTVPEHWPRLVEPGKRNVGYTTWETDALPPHWSPLLATADKLLVPSTMNGELFDRARLDRPVHVVPHIRRHAWNTPTPDEKVALRRRLGIPGDHFVFYTIGAWDRRKALHELVALFARQFSAHDKVSLLIKTSAAPSWFAAAAQAGERIPSLVRKEVDAAYADNGVAAAPIALLSADDVSGRTIDVLHAVGDCFVSLTRGEGWGRGPYDAATLGKPIIITGWGGHLDFLGADSLFVQALPERLFGYDFVLGEEPPQAEPLGVLRPSLCNAVIMGRPGATFATRWLEQMRRVYDGSWDRHSAREAARLWAELPGALHVVPQRFLYRHAFSREGLHTLLTGFDPDYNDVYSMHLWAHLWWDEQRTDFTDFHAGLLTEAYIRSEDTTYNVIARQFLG